MNAFVWTAGLIATVMALKFLHTRVRLSRAKHPSLQGHARLARRIAKLVRFYDYRGDRFFGSDGASLEVVTRRQAGFGRLARLLQGRAPQTIGVGAAVEPGVSDLQFTNAYRVPFQYRRHVAEHLKLGSLLEQSFGVRVVDLDGRVDFDVTGSYGVNLFGYDFYKDCIDAG